MMREFIAVGIPEDYTIAIDTVGVSDDGVTLRDEKRYTVYHLSCRHEGRYITMSERNEIIAIEMIVPQMEMTCMGTYKAERGARNRIKRLNEQ